MLTNHLVHYHCSPTRRSFVSGRLPIHHGEELSPTVADNVDLRWSLISNKLQNAGYKTHWVGKGHVGFLSTAHLPTHRGFDSFTGFLAGGQSYTSSDRWHNEGPLNDTTYSSDLYGRTAVAIVEEHPDPAGTTSPLFVYLPWQAVHSPYDAVPGFDCETEYPPYPGVYAGMLNEADIYMGQLRTTLHQRKMWDNSLLVYCSDKWVKLANSCTYATFVTCITRSVFSKLCRHTLTPMVCLSVSVYACLCRSVSLSSVGGCPRTVWQA